jgi:hypothetical protein
VLPQNDNLLTATFLDQDGHVIKSHWESNPHTMQHKSAAKILKI